jgi:hypothetical protein
MKHRSIGGSNCYSDSSLDVAKAGMISTAAATPQQQTVFIRSASVAETKSCK